MNGIGKDGIVSEGIFVRFPELVPVCREHYWREDGKHKKLLDAERWYKAADAKLIPDYRRTAVSNDIGYKTFDKVFVLMGKVLDEYGIEHVEGLGEAAFYNYFLRPAYGRHFEPQPIDKEVAGEALSGIIHVIKPELIVFLSKKACLAFDDYCQKKNLSFEGVHIEQLVHPSSPWWNSYGCAAKFENLLKEYWVNR